MPAGYVPAIWTIARNGDLEGLEEWCRVRGARSPTKLGAIVSSAKIRANVNGFTRVEGLEVTAGKTLCTPLHVAVLHGRFKMVRALLALGADPSPHNLEGETPLMEMACRTHGEYAYGVVGGWRYMHSIMPQPWGGPGPQPWGGPVDMAIQRGKMDILLAKTMRLLLQCGADVNRQQVGDRRSTALHNATTFPLAVATLLAYGADTEARTQPEVGSETALLTYLGGGFSEYATPESIRLLIRGGANVFARCDKRYTAVEQAMKQSVRYPYGGYPRNGQLVMAQAKRVEDAQRNARNEAFAMGKVERLGVGSRVLHLSPDLIRVVLEM